VTQPAGVVNAAGRADDAAFADLVATSSPEVQAIAWAIRDLVYDVLPATVEVVWPRQRTVGWGTGPRKYSEHFCYLLPSARHVTLGFYRGGELPDPSGLLPAGEAIRDRNGLSMRSLRLTSVAEVQRPELRTLIEVATRTGVPPPRG
jgi:hypothetical protein